MAAEIFQVGDAMLSKMTEAVRTEYQRKREVLNQSEMSVKSKNSFQEFQQRDYKKETGYTLDELVDLARARKEGKTDVNPYARKSVDPDEVVAEEETEAVTEEPVMCL